MKDAAKRLLMRFGLEVRRTRASSDPWKVQRHLLRRDDPLILDVGAHEGETVSQYTPQFPEARFHCFEPTCECAARLRGRYAGNRRVTVHEVALSNAVGHAEFHRHREDSTDMNSLLASDSAGTKYYLPTKDAGGGVVSTPTTTVDEFCGSEKIEQIDILKIDVQGAEMLVLEGAGGAFERRAVTLVFLEVNFCQLYERQAQFHEIAGFLSARGMRLFGMYDVQYGRDGSFAWCNALFAPVGLQVNDIT